MSNNDVNNLQNQNENLLLRGQGSHTMGQVLYPFQQHVSYDMPQTVQNIVPRIQRIHMLQAPLYYNDGVGNNFLEYPEELTSPPYNFFLRILTGSVSQILHAKHNTLSSYMYEVTGILAGMVILNSYCPPGSGNEMIFYLRDNYNSGDVVQVNHSYQMFPQAVNEFQVGQKVRCLGKILDDHTILAMKMTIISPNNAIHYGRLGFVSQKVSS